MLNQSTQNGLAVSQGAGKSGRVYLVHAVVLEVSGHAGVSDELLMGKLVRRRLNRLERVMASFGGAILKQMPDGLLGSFETAEAAVLGACEMQRRCAVIPQLSETQIALKIGIHSASLGLIENGVSDLARATGARLATLLDGACIVLSGNVVDALPPELHDKAAPVSHQGTDITAYVIDWDSVPMTRTPVSAAPSAEGRDISKFVTGTATHAPSLVLVLGDKTYRFGPDHPVITIGRDPSNDIQIINAKASRLHCRIINQFGRYVLFDISTNGTFIRTSEGNKLVALKKMVPLSGSGWLSFGHVSKIDDPLAFAFEVISTGL